jgi:hypothetical protein
MGKWEMGGDLLLHLRVLRYSDILIVGFQNAHGKSNAVGLHIEYHVFQMIELVHRSATRAHHDWRDI